MTLTPRQESVSCIGSERGFGTGGGLLARNVGPLAVIVGSWAGVLAAHMSRKPSVCAGPQVAVCGPRHRGHLLLGLLPPELVKGRGAGLGDRRGVPLFTLVPLPHEHGRALFEQ